jgi:hypothetical protein
VSVSSAGAAPVEWAVLDGGNGHSYEAVVFDDIISWSDADAEAKKRGGYLATITSKAENDFVYALIASSTYWFSSYGPWIGGLKISDERWGWEQGDSFTYTNWCPGEPNNIWGDEDRIEFFADSDCWNDQSNNGNGLGANPIAFVVEYDQ